MDEPRVRWAIVGTSTFAVDWIAPAIQSSPVACLAAVVSSSEERARSVAEKLGAVHAASGLRHMAPGDVDAVHLVTPNEMHADQTVEALERGWHVLVEKPMALDTVQARRMVDAARSADRLLAVGHCMAWAPPIASAIRSVADGAIGLPVEVRIAASFDSAPAGTWRQMLPTEAGGGPMMDLGPHAIDAAIRLLGPVDAVSCRLDRLVYPYPAEDTASLLLRFASGAHGTVRTTFVCGQNELVVQGTKGRLRSSQWLGRDFEGDLSFEPPDHGVGRFDVDEHVRSVSIPLVPTNVYRPQVDEVSRAILDRGATRISGEHGLAVMAVLEAAIRSARTGREVTVQEVLDR